MEIFGATKKFQLKFGFCSMKKVKKIKEGKKKRKISLQIKINKPNNKPEMGKKKISKKNLNI